LNGWHIIGLGPEILRLVATERAMRTIWARLSVFVLLHALILAGVFTVAASARADVLYDPPVGSRWTIQRDLHKEEVSHENGKTDVQKSTLKITAELIVKAKTAGGFQVIYARRKSSYDGENAGAMRASLAALENIEMRATTDPTGKPQRVENFEDIKAGVRKMIDTLAATTDRETAAALRTMLSGMTQIDGIKAAELYLDELGDLAAGQNTGLKAGEQRQTTVTLPNPMGPGFVSTRTLAMISADPAKGDAKLVLTEVHDPESIRAFIVHLLKSSGANPDDAKTMELSLEAKSDIEVAGGMTRSLKRESTTSNRLLPNYRIIKSFKTVTVTPAK
jgi:hypothetical protein